MSMSISIHSTTRLTIDANSRGGTSRASHWIEFTAIDFQGTRSHFNIFFEDEVYMRKLAHAINQVNAAHSAKGPYPNCRHPDQCPGYCTRDPACSE